MCLKSSSQCLDWKRRFTGLQFCPQPLCANAQLLSQFFSQIILPWQIPCHTMRALVPCQCLRGHALARRRWRSGCEVRREDLQVFSALHRSVPMRNYSANFFHRSFCLCRFHATPRARSSHARADMHAAAVQPPPYLVISVLNLPKLIYYALNMSRYI